MSYAQPAFKLLRDEGSDGTYEHLDQFGRVKVQHWKANGGSTMDRVEYAYDDASNLTLRDIPSSLYDTNDRDQTYGYDGLHRRVTKTVGGTTEQHYYNENWQCVEVRIGTESGPARQKYIWQPYYIDALACRFADVDSNGNFSGTDEVEFPTHDANFNVTALVNAAGTVFERYYYSPYGKLNVLDANFAADADGASDVANTFTYTGRQFDSESGVYQYRYRFYHAQLGRFVGRDPAGYVDGYSLYMAYFAPENTDPSGTQVGQLPPLPPSVLAPTVTPCLEVWSCGQVTDWTPSDCECSCSATRDGRPGSGASECQAALDLERTFLTEPDPSLGNIVIGRFFCADDCGGTDFALTCWRPITTGPDKGKVKLGVCIPKGRRRTACEIRALIVHELRHIRDLISLSKGKSGPSILNDFDNINRDAFEEAAYREQCSEYAAQNCLKDPDRENWIKSCTDALKPLSTNSDGVNQVSGGCRAIDF